MIRVRLSGRELGVGQRTGDGVRVEVAVLDRETERVREHVRLGRRKPGVGQRTGDGVRVEHAPIIAEAEHRGDWTIADAPASARMAELQAAPARGIPRAL